jgi:hypothetical protein
MQSKLFEAFLIGTSLIVLLPFFLGIQLVPDLRSNIDFATYPIIAAFYFGMMNVFSQSQLFQS